jgi:hypothetical protein
MLGCEGASREGEIECEKIRNKSNVVAARTPAVRLQVGETYFLVLTLLVKVFGFLYIFSVLNSYFLSPNRFGLTC